MRTLYVRRWKLYTTSIVLVIFFHAWLSLVNPYARWNIAQQPFSTSVQTNGQISYTQHYQPRVCTNLLCDLLGYYRQGFLIIQNTYIGGRPAKGDTAAQIIDYIHRVRFDPRKPYLISGDQFSVLYLRNLGVFYNQLLDPATAHNARDWENRQRLYVQSVLYGLASLSKDNTPKTTAIPIGPKAIVTTQVHPGGVGSDTVYGVLYALDAMQTDKGHAPYPNQTKQTAAHIIHSHQADLRHMVVSYQEAVQDPQAKLVKKDLHLASARDGVIRSSSFYDNVILWKTLALADKMGIHRTDTKMLDEMKMHIIAAYWDEQHGYFHNAADDDSFSSDFLIAYVTKFLDLHTASDLEKTKRVISYVQKHHIAEPLPIRYQDGESKNMPWVIRRFVSAYGSETIWSYWGAQYITLLADVYDITGDEWYEKRAQTYIDRYERVIVRDKGFAETYNKQGEFFRIGPYKSIRITGWVVQFEHAKKQLQQAESAHSAP